MPFIRPGYDSGIHATGAISARELNNSSSSLGTVTLLGILSGIAKNTISALSGSTGSSGSFSWGSTGATSYDIGWDTVSHSAGDINDPTLYPNRVSVGTSLSWSNNTGQTVYAAVRSVVSGELGPWSTETGPLAP